MREAFPTSHINQPEEPGALSTIDAIETRIAHFERLSGDLSTRIIPPLETELAQLRAAKSTMFLPVPIAAADARAAVLKHSVLTDGLSEDGEPIVRLSAKAESLVTTGAGDVFERVKLANREREVHRVSDQTLDSLVANGHAEVIHV